MPSGQLIIIGSIQSLVKPKQKPEKPVRNNFEDSKSGTAEKKYEKALKNYELRLKAFKSRTKKAETLHKLIGTCEMLIIDECDLCTSTTYKHLLRYWFNGRRRYGFTGTPYDESKPVENLVLQEHLGSVIYVQDRESVEKTGLIVPIQYYALAFGDEHQKDDATAFDIAVDEMMVHNPTFHRFIAALCKRFADANEGTLILVERNDLGYALRDIIPDSDFLHGETTRKRRHEMLRDFESRKLKVLIGGKNMRRGLDLKGGCENLILATGGKMASEFKQRIARAARVNQKGSARIFDIYFLCNKYLYEHSRRRFKAAVAAGYESKVMFKTGSIDGEKFLKSRFHIPKAKKAKK
jgi:superfamily II DNA or RNA helicase